MAQLGCRPTTLLGDLATSYLEGLRVDLPNVHGKISPSCCKQVISVTADRQ